MGRKILETPCIGICTLKDNICIGCKRTIEEIKEAYEKATKVTRKMDKAKVEN
jgi:predicted Fe-S protein YdhL (DUF1289 family)